MLQRASKWMICNFRLFGVLALLLALLPVGCGISTSIPTASAPPAQPNPTAPPVRTQATPTPAASSTRPAPTRSIPQPKVGGILDALTYQLPTHYDLTQDYSITQLAFLAPAYNGLVERDPKDWSKIIPGLAESWDISGDSLLYTFRLRAGVKFSDGTPLSASDVVVSISRVVSPPKGTISAWKDLLGSVTKVESVDERTVTLRLSEPQASLLEGLSMEAIGVYPKRVLDEQGNMKKTILGTGPFKFKSVVQGVQFDLERNPLFWRAGQPYVDGLRWYLIKDAEAQLAAFRTKQVSVGWPALTILQPQQWDVLRRTTSYKVEQGTAPVKGSFGGNNTRAPWSDVRVRKALLLATDLEAAKAVVGHGVHPVGGYMMPGGLWELPQLWSMPGFRQPKDADIAEAKKLLKDAGIPVGYKTTLLTRPETDFKTVGEFAQNQLKKIGIEVELQLLPRAQMEPRLAAGDFDLTAQLHSATIQDPDGWLSSNFLADGATNFYKYQNQKVAALYKQQTSLLNLSDRQAIVRQMLGILYDEAPFVPVYWKSYVWISAPNVHGLTSTPSIKCCLRMDYIWLD